MRPASVTTFRALIIGYFVLYVAAIIVGLFWQNDFAATVDDYRDSIHPGLNVSLQIWTGLTLVFLLTLITSLVGMWFLWRPSRWLYIVALAMGYPIGAYVGVGPVLFSQLEYTLHSISDLILGALMALIFIGPVAKEFRSDRNATNVT